jgi:hypothetical protein
VLTQDEVVKILLPRAQKAWSGLAIKAASGTLTLSELDDNFKNLAADQVRERTTTKVVYIPF